MHSHLARHIRENDPAVLDAFRRYAAPGFDIEYVVLVASQFGVNKVVAYGFGTYRGAGDDLKQTAPAASGERP